VVTDGEYFSPQQWYLCKLHVLAHIKTPLKYGTKIKFHTGTSEIVATVYLLKGKSVSAGEECLIQVRLNEPLVAGPRDRFILRTLSPVKTIGGGMIVEALADKLKRSNPRAVQDAEERARAVPIEKDFVEYCIKSAEAFAATESELSIRTKMRPEPLKKILAVLIEQKKIFHLSSKFFMHRNTSDSVQQQLVKIAGDFVF